MLVIPAIDIHQGQCVRLYQGDFEQATVYAHDPAAVAKRWAEQGAKRLHVVDLDGAKAGRPANLDAIHAIAQAVSIPIELGGGLRTAEDIATVFAAGVTYAILGTIAVQNPAFVQQTVQQFGQRIIVGVDARDGYVATAGWTEVAQVRATDLVAQMGECGVQHIIYTDIARDGTLTEPNYVATAELVHMQGPAIIASGGISHHNHLIQLARIGVVGAIVGKALYTGDIILRDTLVTLEK
jgi:phosphoribosylformimino-5-aminoimidazole carboxamide ribotide isomerase